MSEIIDDEMAVDVAREPAGYALDYCPSNDNEMEIDYNFQGKDFGYARTLDELELALDEADAERSDPSKWITSIDFHTRLESKYSWLR